jgi:MFS family permease
MIAKLGGPSRAFVVGTLGNAIFILSSVLPAYKKQHSDDPDSLLSSSAFIYSAMILAGVICGVSQALLWTSQGFYISQCAAPVQHNKGLYFSLFWSTYMLSQIFGNLAAAFIIGGLSQVTYFYIMTVVCLSSSVIFILLRVPKTQSDDQMLKDGSFSRLTTANELQDMAVGVHHEIVATPQQVTEGGKGVGVNERLTILTQTEGLEVQKGAVP